jgi:hypothetical protein
MRKSGNGTYYLFVLILYSFILKPWAEQYFPFIGYLDEVVALLAVPFFVMNLKKNRFVLKVNRGGMESI